MSNKGMTRQQKEAVGILAGGTFLEYFDMMLFIHMSVVLNDIFFPQDNPIITQTLAATAFCSTYILRPIGGLVIGWIGDKIGRKPTIMITTFIMACSCATIASIPTYAEIGITATIIILLARMFQGVCCLGEDIGALLYLSETLKSPTKYIASGIMAVSARTGGAFSLVVGLLAVSIHFNWRVAFWVGSIVALVGIFARLRLRETPEFVKYKFRIQTKLEKSNKDPGFIKGCLAHLQEKTDKRMVLAYMLSIFIVPVAVYITYGFLSDFMKKSLNMSASAIMQHNLIVAMSTAIGSSIVAYFAKRHHPLKITKITLFLFIIILPFIPYYLNNMANSISLIFLQLLIYTPLFTSFINMSVWFKYFPISSRFTIVASFYGISTALGYATASFGLIALTEYFGYYGLWFIYIPIVIGFLYSIEYLKKLEIEKNLYHDYQCGEEPGKPDTILEDHRYDDEDYLGDEYEPFKGRCEFSTTLLNKLEALNKTMDRKVNINAVKHAITFAKKWHHGQVRKKDGIPFHSHPIAVAELLSTYYFKTDVIIASLLHDTVEDDKTGECTVELIEEKFNTRIAEMVNGLTKYQKIDGKETILTLEQTLRRLHKAEDYETLFIKEMDRTHNLQTADGLKPEKRRKMAEETTRYMLPGVAYVAEKLNIHGKVHLENKVFKLSHDILKKTT